MEVQWIREQCLAIRGIRDVNIFTFLDFSFRYYSLHQKYKRLKRYVAQYDILLHRVTLRNEFSYTTLSLVNVCETTVSSVTLFHFLF